MGFFFTAIGINTSVTVRKPQAIPPSGMPAKAKQNHVVPVVTVDNNAQFGDTASAEQHQDGDGNVRVIINVCR